MDRLDEPPFDILTLEERRRIEWRFSDDPKDVQRLIGEAKVLCTDSLEGAWLKDNDSLQWVHYLSAGAERLPLKVLAGSKLRVTTSRGVHAIPVSEHALGMMLALSRKLPRLLNLKERKVWDHDLQADEIFGKTLLVIGVGHIGLAIARKAKCFGMQICAVDPNPTVRLDTSIDEYEPPERMAECLARADVVVISAPLVESTEHLFGTEEFKTMKKTAVLINVSRGRIVDETALTVALKSGAIAGAGLDVFEREPLPAQSGLWDMDNVIVSPHVAGMCPRYMERLWKCFLENLKRFMREQEGMSSLDLKKGY